MPELTDAQKVMRNDTGKRMADALEALAGTGGRGLPAGGTDGDVLVKNGATDYDARWEKPQYCRPNLLDNWYFVGGGSQQGAGYFPINQRGQSYYPNAGYCIDRWKIVNGSLTLQNTGLLLSQAACFLIQSLSDGVKDALDGKTLTFSYLDSYNHLVTGSTVYRKQPAENIYFAVGDHYQLLISTNGDPLIWCAAPTALLSAVKLELGSYQTLAHNEGTEANPNWVLNAIPDWNTERYKCDPTIGSNLATIETSPATQAHAVGEYIVYNGQLYKAVKLISPQDSLNPDANGNIKAVENGGFNDIPVYKKYKKSFSVGANGLSYVAFWKEEIQIQGKKIISGFTYLDSSQNGVHQIASTLISATNTGDTLNDAMYVGLVNMSSTAYTGSVYLTLIYLTED